MRTANGPPRPRMALADFSAWARGSQDIADRVQAENSAMDDHARMLATLVESRSYHLGKVGSGERHVTAPASQPFLLLVTATPLQLLRRWDEDAGGNVLDPIWHVKVMNPPGGPRFTDRPGQQAWIFARSYAVPPRDDPAFVAAFAPGRAWVRGEGQGRGAAP